MARKGDVGAGNSGTGVVGKRILPFGKKSPSLEASPTKGIESFSGSGGGSGGDFMAKNNISGGLPTPLKGKESALSMDTTSIITNGGGNFLASLKKSTSVAGDGTKDKASLLPPRGVLGKGFSLSTETLKVRDISNGETPTKTSFFESLSNGNVGAMKAKSDSGSTNPTKKSFLESFSKGKLGKMMTKGGPLPLPPPLKGMQVSSTAKLGRDCHL